MIPKWLLLSVRLVSVAIAALLSTTSLTAAQSKINGVIGKDDRRILTESDGFFNAIGRVNVASYKRKSLCTGTLIAPDKVITAAHCIHSSRTGRLATPQTIHFVAGKRQDKHVAHSTVKSIKLMPNFDYRARTRRGFFENDVALLVLKTPMKLQTPPFAKPENTENLPLAHILYSRNRPNLPAIDETCQRIGGDDKLWLTNCDTNFGGSGGPVFQRSDNGLLLTGVMVAISRKRGSFVVPVSRFMDLLEN